MPSPSFVKYASVVLDLYLDKTLDYGINEGQASLIKKGMQVEVPVRESRYDF